MHSATAVVTDRETRRFTLDGNPELEARLAEVCAQVRRAVLRLVPARQLDGLVLGGGYGRGEGGVRSIVEGEAPYNDMEFYVFLRGNRLWNDRRYSPLLRQLAEELSPAAKLHVEFKVESLPRLRRSAVSMFSYDLVSRSRRVFGAENLFDGCDQHLEARNITAADATRLLFNRCTGLLLAKEILSQPLLTEDDTDFVARNLAKVQLALGDAVLTVFGSYHWSCRERHERLQTFSCPDAPPWLAQVQRHHTAGVRFKLHPRSEAVPDDLVEAHRDLCELALEVWLWLENRRLNRSFYNVRDYALSPVRKCSESASWRNYLLTLRTFGPKAVFGRPARSYPRERLLNTLPLFLSAEISAEPDLVHYLQEQLHTTAGEWTGLVKAYKRVWAGYG